MELSRYCRILDLPGHPAERVLFSTRTAAAVRLPAEAIPDLSGARLAPQERETLAGLGLLVESVAAEREEILGYLDALAAQARTLRAIVLLNLDCNLACSYCFEGSRKDRSAMSRATAGALLAFLRRHRLPGQEGIALTFSGGEPLLSSRRLVEIAAGVGEMARGEGLAFRFTLTTNGTLITRGLVERLRPLGLERVSVTLDGPREVHDRMRPFRGRAGGSRSTYDVILRNLREVARLVPVQIGGNFTQESWRDLPLLLDALAAAGLGREVVTDVRFDPVLQERDGIAPPEFRGGCCTTNEPWLAEATVALRGELIRRGYRPPRVTPALCMIDLPHQLVVDVQGNFFKCPGLIGRPEYCVGSLERGVGDCSERHRQDLWKNGECLACAYLPLCFGGCRYLRLLREGSPDGLDCRRPFLDAVLGRLVMQDLGLGSGP